MTEPESLRGRRVLITGHTGFKGGWLAIWLHALGAKVAGYALDPPAGPSMFDSARVANCLNDYRGDVRDVAAVRNVMQQVDPEIVFHLAAQSVVSEGYRSPIETYSVNVVGTATVLDACRDAKNLCAIVVVTSDKCYENRNWAWGYRENDRLGGRDPYSSSKACQELVTDAFRQSFLQASGRSVGVATARAGNVLGGGDWAADRLVPDLARAVSTGDPAEIRIPGAVRPWQHVLEPVSGYLLLARRLIEDPAKYSGGWNFGPSAAAFHTVADISHRVERLWGGKLQLRTGEDTPFPEAARLRLDSSRANSELDWHPRMSIDEALQMTVEWYATYLERPMALPGLTVSQVARYARLVER